MTDMNDLGRATETLARAFEEYKSTNDMRLADIEQRGSSDVVIDDKLQRLDSTITELQDELSSVKTALRRPSFSTDGPSSKSGHYAHKNAFMSYITKGIESGLHAHETKALSVINNAEGGFMVPAEMAQRIVTRQFDTTPMRQLATVMTVSSDAVEMLRDTAEPSAQWVSETATRSDTNDGGLGRVRIPVHELFAQPKATQKLLDDAVLNVEEWIINKVADKFARAENAAFVSGDGVGQPRGFTSYSAQAVDDSSRSWGVLQYVATGVDGGFSSSNPADTLIDLHYKLRAGYLPKAAWLMPRAIANQIRKFKQSTTQNYIWQPGLTAGQPATLLGYPVYLAEDMPTLATGSLSLAFGNFEEGYTIVDRAGMTVLRDPYTGAPYVKFRCTKRTGGDVVNFDAIKLLKFAAS